MQNKFIGDPRKFSDLPQETQAICNLLKEKLESILHDNFHGLYLYGAMVFPESDHVIDIDFHVILKAALNVHEKESVIQIHKTLVGQFDSISMDDLDGWYILLDDVNHPAPMHQIKSNLYDRWWSLHRAHMRAGYCIVLKGPDPKQIFPSPTWTDLESSLNLELKSIMVPEFFLRYPWYCILNACRIMYSYKTKNVVISKRASADWAIDRFPVWKFLINAAVRSYAKAMRKDDLQLLESETESFLRFAVNESKSSKAG